MAKQQPFNVPSSHEILRKAAPITPSNVLPTDHDDWSGYWTFVAAMSFLMFFIYIAVNGQLASWIGLLTYTAPTAVVASGTTTSATTTPATGSTTSVAASPSATTGASASSPTVNTTTGG